MTIAQTILETLRTWHRQQAGELLRRLGVSRPSLMRAIAELDGQVISRGRARRTAYAARRAIRGNPNPLPLYRIDALGRAHEAGLLEPVYPEGCALSFTETCPWPLDDEMTDGWFRSLPLFFWRHAAARFSRTQLRAPIRCHPANGSGCATLERR